MKMLDKETELTLINKYQETNDKKSLDILILSHMPLIRSIAFRMIRNKNGSLASHRNYDVEDLIQEGIFGFVHSVKKFNPDIGVRLNTYSRSWIKEYISKFMGENAKSINFKITSDLGKRNTLYHITKSSKKLGIVKDYSEYTSSDFQRIADDIGVNVTKVEDVVSLKLQLLDTDPRSVNDGSVEVMNGIADPNADFRGVFEEYDEHQYKIKSLNEAFNFLSDKEQKVINLLYKEEMSPIDIAKQFGFSRQRVDQIRNKAFEKLKKKLTINGVFTNLGAKPELHSS